MAQKSGIEDYESGPAEKLLTARQAAEILGIAQSTLRAWTRDGRLPSVVLGTRTRRWREADLERLICESETWAWEPLTGNGGYKGRRRHRRRGRGLDDAFDDDLEPDEIKDFDGD